MKFDTNNYYFIMFTSIDDAPEPVSDLFERLIGYKAPDDSKCFEVTRFDDTYIVAYPQAMEIPELTPLCENELYQDFIMESN